MKNVISYILLLFLLIIGARESKAQNTKIICAGSSVTLFGPISPGGVKWFKDGKLIANTQNYVANTAGKFVVVAVSQYGCESDASEPVDVVVSQPPSIPIVSVIQPNCVLNTGTISVSSVSPKNEYSIDGVNFQPNNIFSGLSTGTYSVFAKNENGCISAPTVVNLIKDSPTGDFTASNTSINFGGYVNYTPSVPGAVSYEWNFGDGGTSFESSPKHYYYREGTFTTTLRIKTSGGCDFTITKVNYVKVGPDNNTPNIPVIIPPSGIDNSPMKFFAYPNPFKDKLNISVTSEVSQSVKIELLDMRGNKVYSKDFPVNAGNNMITIDRLPSMGQGVYSLRVTGQGIKNSINLLKI